MQENFDGDVRRRTDGVYVKLANYKHLFQISENVQKNFGPEFIAISGDNTPSERRAQCRQNARTQLQRGRETVRGLRPHRALRQVQAPASAESGAEHPAASGRGSSTQEPSSRRRMWLR